MRQYLRQGSEGDIGSGYQIYVGIYFKKKKIYIYIYIYIIYLFIYVGMVAWQIANLGVDNKI